MEVCNMEKNYADEVEMPQPQEDLGGKGGNSTSDKKDELLVWLAVAFLVIVAITAIVLTINN